MKVTVKKGVALPHRIFMRGQTFEFNPSCEVPDDLGTAMVKNIPHVFTAEASPDVHPSTEAPSTRRGRPRKSE